MTPQHSIHASVSGKFLEAAGERLLVKGVSYGTFVPDADGHCFPDLDRISRDFKAIAELGANTVRTYTPASPALLDEAARRNLYVFAGMPWPQHITFLDNRETTREIRRSVARHVRALAGHPATLLIALGNEIPPGVVRWYGRRRIEMFLRELYNDAKAAAPDALLTYVNFPPTEYLETPFFDVCAFNVFLHEEADLRAYLARLHNIAGPRPLLVAELGADSLRHGEVHQAALVATQLRTALAEGTCGAVVFAWTDDWWRGGRTVDDWAFGLVDAGRRAKLAHQAVRRVFTSAPFREHQQTTWPRVSVVVCAHNAADTIDECLASLEALRYPDFEIVLVNDGSTDGTDAIAARRPRVRVISTPNGGLAAARNVGLYRSDGEIVAYTDADVRVDPDWLAYLVQPFVMSDVMAAGGPNIVPPEDPWFAQAVARAPGSPTHVLLDDRLAEHVPGCNCAFRRTALTAIGGFNPTFLRADDDVDVCWRLQDRGWNIAYAPAALVWHHHRAGVRAYLRQQVGYGEGEAWLIREHPEKFVHGHVAWRGHIYSPLPFIRSLSSLRVNAGPFGSAPFPSIYRTDAHPFAYMPHSGRWQVTWITLLILAALAGPAGSSYAPELLAAGLVAMVATVIKCVLYGMHSDVAGLPQIGRLSPWPSRGVYHAMIAALHFLQPFARLYGHMRGALTAPARGSSRGRARSKSAVLPAVSGLADGIRLILGGRVEKIFWSQAWLDVRTPLIAAAEYLRGQRAVRRIELDSGWWEDRDVTIVDRAWVRFDMRALVEDHGSAGCVYRFAVRRRLAGTSALDVLAIPAIAALLHRIAGVPWLPDAVLASLALATIALAQVSGSARIIADALAAAAAQSGMISVAAGGAKAQKAVPEVAAHGARLNAPAGPPPASTPAMLEMVPADLPTTSPAETRRASS